MIQSRDFNVSLWKLKALGWIGLGFFTLCFVGSFALGQPEVSPWFLPFMALSMPVLLQAGTFSSDCRAISLSIPLGEFEMEWAEIERVERGQSFIVFISGARRLNIPTPEWWAGRDRAAFHDFLGDFLSRRGIEVQQSFLADFRFPKNTKKKPNK